MEGAFAILRELGGLGSASHSEARRDRWLSEHLDRSFSKTPEVPDLLLIMEVVFSKGLHYTARVYDGPL